MQIRIYVVSGLLLAATGLIAVRSIVMGQQTVAAPRLDESTATNDYVLPAPVLAPPPAGSPNPLRAGGPELPAIGSTDADNVPGLPAARFPGVPVRESSPIALPAPPMVPEAERPLNVVSAPEVEHLENWIARTLQLYSASTDEKFRTDTRTEIAKGLDRIFEIRQEHRMKELTELEARVQKLRKTLETRAQMKEEILKDRLDYLIREAEGLGWGDGIPDPVRFTRTKNPLDVGSEYPGPEPVGN